MFQITKLGDLVFILEHFKLYTLKTHKYADYLLFKKAFEFINNKKHLTIEGLHELISIRASVKKGLPYRLKRLFQVLNKYLDQKYLIFLLKRYLIIITLDTGLQVFIRRGYFFIHTSKSKTHKLGISVALNFLFCCSKY
jgi:hypothetical protein